jgi:predicted DNA-binding helix-hairpin-helix protein
VDVNKGSREDLLRVPGLGAKAVQRILASRRFRKLRVEDLRRLRVPLKRVLPFVMVPGAPFRHALDSERLSQDLRPRRAQLSLIE